MKNWMGGWLRGLALAAALATGAAIAADAAPAMAQDGSAQARSTEGVVNINTASVAELSRLPGIGQSRAEAIVAMREQRGAFQRVEQIMQVRGVGRATFRRLQPMLTVDGPTTLGTR